jgi:hypothetical protein
MKIESFKNDGSVQGVLSELNAMYGRSEIDSMIIIVEKKESMFPSIAFCGTCHPSIELGLLELAKIQALRTREIL